MEAWDWELSTPRRVDFEYESLEDIVCHLYELVSLNISSFEGAPRKTLYIGSVTENVSTHMWHSWRDTTKSNLNWIHSTPTFLFILK